MGAKSMIRAAWMLVTLAAVSTCGPSGPDPGDWARRVEARRVAASAQAHRGELEAAVDTLRGALALPAPDGPDAVIGIVQDTRFALGSALLQLGRASEAEAEATRGLELGTGPTVFTANLLALRAMAREAGPTPLDALDDYERAQASYEALFDAALEESR